MNLSFSRYKSSITAYVLRHECSEAFKNKLIETKGGVKGDQILTESMLEHSAPLKRSKYK